MAKQFWDKNIHPITGFKFYKKSDRKVDKETKKKYSAAYRAKKKLQSIKN